MIQDNESNSTTALTNKESVEAKRRLEELDQLRIKTSTEIPQEHAAISVDGIPIFEFGDIGAVKAKQKAGKTTTLKVMVAAWMNGQLFRLASEIEEAKVLWLDTEQKKQDDKKIVNDVQQLSGKEKDYIDSHLKVYAVRSLSYRTLKDDTRLLVCCYRPDVVIIDGLVDYIESFNDESMSHQLINELIHLSGDFQCAVICVLHENKGSDDHNMRGHLGTMLAQKSGTVLQCQKNSRSDIEVSCSDSRHAAMPTWRIRYDEQGHIVQADDLASQTESARRVELMMGIIKENGGSISRKDLTEKLMDNLKLSRPRVSNIISEQLKSSLCEVNGSIQVQPELNWPV